MNADVLQFLNSTPELTLFLPVDSAWEALPHYERVYLESDLATDVLGRMVNMHAVHKRSVAYSESLKNGLNSKCTLAVKVSLSYITCTVSTVDGSGLEISVTDNKTMVSHAELIESDVYASNGVLHTVSDLLVPEGVLQPTPEKYLLLFNCSQFVSLLRSVNLTSLVNDTEAHWTILAPHDDVIAVNDGNLPEKGTAELKRLLQYHFLPGKQTLKKLKNGMLLETALEEPGLAGGKQVLSVEVSESKKKDEGKSVRFGGAGIVGEPGKSSGLV